MNKDIKDSIKTNFKNMEKLDKKYDELITNMVVYIRVNLTEKDAEEAINDILEILLGAQSRGEDLEDIIGGDYKSFCDEVIKSYKEENKLYFLLNFKEISKVVLAMLPFFIALNCIFEITKIKEFTVQAFYSHRYNMGILPVVGNIIAIVVVYSILNYIAKHPGKDTKKDILMFFFIQLVYIGVLVFIGYFLRSIILISIPNYLACLVVSAIVIIGYIVYLKKSTFLC